jgi:hypothetical protein
MDLLPVNLLVNLETEFKLGEESRSIVPSHDISNSQEIVDKMEKASPLTLESKIWTLVPENCSTPLSSNTISRHV